MRGGVALAKTVGGAVGGWAVAGGAGAALAVSVVWAPYVLLVGACMVFLLVLLATLSDRVTQRILALVVAFRIKSDKLEPSTPIALAAPRDSNSLPSANVLTMMATPDTDTNAAQAPGA